MKRIDDLVAVADVKKDEAGKWRTRLPRPEQVKFNPGETWRARMATNKGEVVIRLMPETAPMHVTSFAYLARLGFYDGLAFHRVITGFMAQGGCPLGTGEEGEKKAGLLEHRTGILPSCRRHASALNL